jgi:hypothetical protein
MEGTLEDKVSDFLSEMTPRMLQRRKRLVTAEDVYEMVTEKTGVPVGGRSAAKAFMVAE